MSTITSLLGTGIIATDRPTINTNFANLNTDKEETTNKSTSVVTDQASNIKFPSVKAVYDWAVSIFVTLTGVQVLTNKTLIASTNVISENTTTASSATPTPTGGSLRNYMTITALATAPTFSAPSGTPVDGNLIIVRMKDNGTARAITWNAIYRGGDTTLPTTTIISKTMYLLFIYTSADAKWDLISKDDNH